MRAGAPGGLSGDPLNSGREEALEILFGQDYHAAKVEIMRPLNSFFEEMNGRIEAEVQGRTGRQRTLFLLQFLVFVVAVGAVVLLILTAAPIMGAWCGC